MDDIIKRLERLERLIESQSINTKDVQNFNKACQYLELSQLYLQRLTSSGTKPNHKHNCKKTNSIKPDKRENNASNEFLIKFWLFQLKIPVVYRWQHFISYFLSISILISLIAWFWQSILLI